MTQVYEIAVDHCYLGFGYYGDKLMGIFRRNIRLPEDYQALGETVFFTREAAEENLETIKALIVERNNKRWDKEEEEARWREQVTMTGLIPHSHSLNTGSAGPQDAKEILYIV